MLRIQFSNRFEVLLDALLEGLDTAPTSVFAAEQVIVPSAALQRRLSLAIAERRGICCNVEFSFLAQWLWRQIGALVPTVAADSPFAAPVLAWRIFEIFGDAEFVAAEPRLRDYLSQASPVLRHALAERSAMLIEQYLTYRPEWLAAWSAHEAADIGGCDALQLADERWQAALWRRLSAQLGIGRQHPATVFLDALETAPRDQLPAQLHVFCLPAMPPLYARLLQQLGRWIDLRLYVLNPCREYWFEVVDQRRLAHLALRGAQAHHEVGNRLLAAWGRQTQAQVELLLQADDEAIVEDVGFVESPSTSLLGRLQNAVLDLVELEPAVLAPEDRSIEIHVCHSLTRELEALQDRLLTLFASDPTLQPSQILVATPDLEAAAPLIEAVFDNAPRACAIPYAITGRPRSKVNAGARALLALLGLVGSRFQASRVFELLQQPAVGRRFGLEGDALESVRNWLMKAGIRWGLDGAHRASFDLPAVERHSFGDGLHRLYLGYALPAAVDALRNGRLPAGDAEGSEADALGAFWHFVTTLQRWQRELSTPKIPDDWLAMLSSALADLLAPAGDEIDDVRDVQAALRELHGQMANAELRLPIPLDVVRSAVQGVLDDSAHGGVPGGNVTFAAIGSLRSLPYRVVCMIGLDDGAFPTTTRPAEFDLMAIRPRRSDRQRRRDERNLFLDMLLAASERLHLSYSGRSVRDNAALPASVLVSELLDYLVPVIAADGTATARAAAHARLVVTHPLQPFSRERYSADADPRLRSHNEEYAEALRQQREVPAFVHAPGANADTNREGDTDLDDDRDVAAQPAFFTQPLAAPGAEWHQVTLEQLTRFFRNPSRYLLQRRLGIALARAEDELQDDEPFMPEFHARTALAERLLPQLLQGAGRAALSVLARAGGEYPTGRLGERLLERELQSLERYAHELRQASVEPCLPAHNASLAFELEGEPWRLDAGWSELRTSGLLCHRYDDARPVDRLEAWLAHLLLCATVPPGVALQTAWHARDGILLLPPATEARDTLQELLRLYRLGLTRPLHFYPKSAWSYVSHGGSRHAAVGTWSSTRQRPYGEDADAAYQLALRGVAKPLDDEFEACASAVFGTMQACLQNA